jgi:hypothetical protein
VQLLLFFTSNQLFNILNFMWMYSNINEYLESRPGHSTMEDKSFIYSRELDTFLSCSWYQTYTKLFNIQTYWIRWWNDVRCEKWEQTSHHWWKHEWCKSIHFHWHQLNFSVSPYMHILPPPKFGIYIFLFISLSLFPLWLWA